MPTDSFSLIESNRTTQLAVPAGQLFLRCLSCACGPAPLQLCLRASSSCSSLAVPAGQPLVLAVPAGQLLLLCLSCAYGPAPLSLCLRASSSCAAVAVPAGQLLLPCTSCACGPAAVRVIGIAQCWHSYHSIHVVVWFHHPNYIYIYRYIDIYDQQPRSVYIAWKVTYYLTLN